MENMQNTQGTKNMCKCPHHKTLPILVILFGLTFLLGNLGIVSSGFANIVWPVLIIVAGGMKLGDKMGMCKCC